MKIHQQLQETLDVEECRDNTSFLERALESVAIIVA
jgi:hypothetical protein